MTRRYPILGLMAGVGAWVLTMFAIRSCGVS